MKVFSEESALQLTEKLLQNDKDIKTEIEGKIPSVDGLATEKYVDSAVKNVEVDLTGYATESYVTNAIANAQLGGGDTEVDLSGYATKDDLKGYAAKEHTHDEYLTKHQDISGKADVNHKHTMNDITDYEAPDLSDYALKSEIPTDYLSSIPDEYITEAEMTEAINSAKLGGETVDLSEYAKKTDIPVEDNVYYFSVDGDDNNSGKYPDEPKKTYTDYITNGNTLYFKAGDTFLLNEPLSILDKQNITITSYGNGMAKFSGLHISENTFVVTGTDNLYKIQFDKDIDPGFIIVNGQETKNWKRLSTEPTIYNEGEWYFDRVNYILYYYSSTSVEGKSVSYSLGTKGIIIARSLDIKISNMEVSDFAYHGISIEYSSSNILIDNNKVHDIGGGIDTQDKRYGNAIQLWLVNIHDIYVENNTIHDVFDTGITPQGTGGHEDCYNLYIRRNDIRRCAFMLEFFNSTSNISVTAHFDDNFLYQVKDISEGYRTSNEYAYTHLSFILVWNSSSNNDKIYYKNNICVESEYCALAFSQDTVRNKLVFENNLFICDPSEAIHNSHVLNTLPEVISIRNSGLTEDEINSLIDIKLEEYEPNISTDVIAQAVSDYLTDNPVSGASVEKLERIYFNVDGGQYWNQSGELVEHLTKVSATSLEQVIPVSEGEKYRVTLGGIWVGSNPALVVFLDNDKNFVSVPFNNANVTAKEFVVPSNAAYMGITVWSGIEPIVYRVSTLVSYSDDKIREEHLTRMKHEQNIQHTVRVPYYKTPTKPYITFVHDDCRAVFDVLAQHFIDRNIPLCVATPPNALAMCSSVGDLSMKEVLDNVVAAGGEVLVHHANQMTQAMLEDYDTCFEHFVNAKKVLEECGYEVNGIILAGGNGQVTGSPISDMWIRSYYLYSDLYGEEEYKEPYHHARQSLVNLGNFDAAKATVQKAINNNEWLVMYTHDWNDFSEDNLTQLLDWINEQNISVYTYKQVYDDLIAYKGVVENTTTSGTGIGTMDYSELQNKPSINGVQLNGNKTMADLGIVAEADEAMILSVISKYFGDNNFTITWTEEETQKTITAIITPINNGGNGNNSNPDDPGTDTEEWDDTATVTAAWRTSEGIFSNTTITEQYTLGTQYNVSCKLMFESDSATNGKPILRLGGSTSDLGTISFGEIVDVNVQMEANNSWTVGNMQPSIYTTEGSGFPWTVYIKDFAISEVV